MAVTNPCCCKLQLGVTIVAIVNMVISCSALLWYLVTLLIGSVALAAVSAQQNQGQRGQRTQVEIAGNATIAVLGMLLLIITVIFIISSLITFVTSFILFIGARKKEVNKCRLWFVVTLIFLIIYIFFKIFNIGVSLWAWEENERRNTPVLIAAVVKECVWGVFSLAIEGYQLWVVYAFIDEIKREELNPSAHNPNAGVVHYAPQRGDEPPPYGSRAVNMQQYPGEQMHPFLQQPQHGPMSSSRMAPPMDVNFQYK